MRRHHTQLQDSVGVPYCKQIDRLKSMATSEHSRIDIRGVQSLPTTRIDGLRNTSRMTSDSQIEILRTHLDKRQSAQFGRGRVLLH